MKGAKKSGRLSLKVSNGENEVKSSKISSELDAKTDLSPSSGRPSRSSAGKKVFDGFLLETKKRKRSDQSDVKVKDEESKKKRANTGESADSNELLDIKPKPLSLDPVQNSQLSIAEETEKPKRRPGRPKKSVPNPEESIVIEDNDKAIENGNLDLESQNSDNTKPKRKPGRPKKNEESFNNELSEKDSLNSSHPKKPSKSLDESWINGDSETEEKIADNETEKPKRRPGRPKKSVPSEELVDNNEMTVTDSLNSILEETDKSIVENGNLEIESQNTEEKPKRRPGRPRKLNKNEESDSGTKETTLNEESIVENGEEADLNFKDVIPKRRPGRKKKKSTTMNESTVEEKDSPNLNNRALETESEEEIKPKRRPGRPKKIVQNLEESGESKKSSKENSGGEDDDPDFKLTAEARAKRYTSFDPDSASSHLDRLDYSTPVKDKNKKVECAVCGETMTVVVYQKQHMAKHNFLCWLKGENALDVDNEILIERVLCRAKVHFPKAIFVCSLCGNEKKSARGFISHRQFCGKSQEEKKNLMVTCHLCARVVMPSSFEIHMAGHTAKKVENNDFEPLGTRRAAEKCSYRPANNEDDSEDDLSEFYTIIKYNKRDYLESWEEKCLNDETIVCPCPNCDFKTDRLTQMKIHFKDCSKNLTRYQCSECDHSSSTVIEINTHIQNLHSLNVSMARKKVKDAKDYNFENGLLFIPYLRNTEHIFHTKVNPSKFFTPAIPWTKQLRSIHYSHDKLFENFRVEKSDWEVKNELKKYFQDTEKSLRISLNSENWFTMDKYEVRTEENMSLIFCGGPVFGLAWAPGAGAQYLAVGAHLSMTNFYQVGSTCSDSGNIQIWSFPHMGNKKNSSMKDAKLEYLICHDSGGAWGMEWCPSGCRDDERLGLLAVNCASGSIPIFSIPIPKSGTNFRPCKPRPVLMLELGPHEKCQCSKISWSKVKPHRIIAGGFVNGFVALWDLMTESVLLKKGRNLYPFRIFQAHHSIITGIAFSPTSDSFLATTSNDKSLKFWDINDTTCPISKQSKNSPTDLTWLPHWMSCSTSIDNIYATGDFNMTISCIRDLSYEPQTYLTNVDSTSLSISGNDWMNGVATSFDNGQVNIVFSRRQPLMSHDDRKKYIKVIIEPNLFDFDKDAYAQKPKNKEKPNFEINDSQSYTETASKYGIHFKTDLNFGFEDRLKGNAASPIFMYPINAANKVCWNPNMDSFTNFAVGYQSGFVIVSKLNFCVLDQNHIDEVYKD